MATSLGKYYDAINAGNVFIGSSAAAGAAVPIITGTAITFALWNTSTTHNAVLLKINIGYTSGTLGVSEFGLGTLISPIFATATGGILTAFTDAVPGQTLKNAKVGSGKASVMRFAPATATAAASSAFPWYWLGTSSLTAASTMNASHDLDGLIVTPGQLVFLGSSVAQAGLVTNSLMWAEVPV